MTDHIFNLPPAGRTRHVMLSACPGSPAGTGVQVLTRVAEAPNDGLGTVEFHLGGFHLQLLLTSGELRELRDMLNGTAMAVDAEAHQRNLAIQRLSNEGLM